MKKAEFSLLKLPIAILLFSMVIVVFFFVPYNQDKDLEGDTQSFWKLYEYDPTSSTEFDAYETNKNISDIAASMACDLTGTTNNSRNCPQKSIESGSDSQVNFLDFVAKTGWGAVNTLFQSVGTAKYLLINVLSQYGTPGTIVQIIVSILIILTLGWILNVIYGRGSQ